MSQLACWTMVRDEPYFLPLWVAYYSRFVPRSSLFIIVDGLDGLDGTPPEAIDGCQILYLPRREQAQGFDLARWAFLSQFASALTARFDVVLGGDVDELVVLDPAIGDNLATYLVQDETRPVVSPFAFELVHRVDLEQPLDQGRPILQQRKYGRINLSYCKPCIIRTPVKWSIGGHYSDHPTLALSDHLTLFHLRYLDREMLLARQAARFAQTVGADGAIKDSTTGHGWRQSGDEMDAFLQSFVSKGAPEQGDFTFGWQRKRLCKSWSFDEKKGFWKHMSLHNRRSYTVPDRFLEQF